MRISTAALSLTLLLVVLGGAGGAAGAGPESASLHAGLSGGAIGSSSSPGAAPSVADAWLQDAEERPVTVDVQIRENGDADFEIRKQFPRETEAERESFEEVASDFRFGREDLGFAANERAVQRVDPSIEREMSITSSRREVERSNDTGTLIREFTWSNFARPADDRVEVGDAFRTENGVWLQSLGTNTRLVIRAPDGYRVTDSPQGPRVEDGEDVIWTGPRSFERSDLQITFGAGDGSNLFTYLVLGLVGLAILALGWLMFRREEIGDRSESGTDTDPVADLLAGLPWIGDDVEGTGTESHDTDATSPSGDAPAAPPEPADEPVDPELLSDGERVEWLLERHGGRMKQSNVVSETGWSNAKVSQLLSEMAADDRVDKLRIGRENLITLPEEDVATEDQ